MKFGIDSLAKAMPVMKRSKVPPLRTAHWMAKGMPIKSAAISASSISSRETGKRARMAPQHRLAGPERPAEVALQDAAEPTQVAPPDRLIEPHVATQGRDRLGRRLIAQHGMGEIAGQQRRDQERQQRDGEQHGHQIAEPVRDESPAWRRTTRARWATHR